MVTGVFVLLQAVRSGYVTTVIIAILIQANRLKASLALMIPVIVVEAVEAKPLHPRQTSTPTPTSSPPPSSPTPTPTPNEPADETLPSTEFFFNDLVKLACEANSRTDDHCKAIYYLGRNGKRYTFPNEKIYKTWYSDFSNIKIITLEDLAKYRIGGNVTYRPGVRLIKIQSDPKVYAVARNGALRWIKTEAAAKKFYGDNWNTIIYDIPASFFVNYTMGEDIDINTEHNRTIIQNSSPDINTDKRL